MCPTAAEPRSSNLFDPAYYEDLMARPFREGTIGESPVLPGTGMFMPVGTGQTKDKGLFRRVAPVFNASKCTGCLDCAMVCPDVAIPNTVHEIHDLLLTGIASIDATEGQREALRAKVYPLAERVRESYRQDKTDRDFSDVVAEAAKGLDADKSMRRHLDDLVTTLATFPVARTRPFFDSMEKEVPGSGGLFSAAVDPWKCTGCLQCVEVCGAGALTEVDQTEDVLATLEEQFTFMSKLPNTPKRFTEGSTTPDGDIKRMLLDHTNYYATTGGHGACRGCGEVTAIRLVTSMSRALGDERRARVRRGARGPHREARRPSATALTAEDTERANRLSALMVELDKALYLSEAGPTGGGPAPTVVANATGCSSVYASTMPFTPVPRPVGQQPVPGRPAAGIGHLRRHRHPAGGRGQGGPPGAPRARGRLRPGRPRQGAAHARMARLHPPRNSRSCRTCSRSVETARATTSASARCLACSPAALPVKMLVLNTGAYSNTGGQASTASFIGQDADLARYGKAHEGKHEGRKDLALLASFHPGVFASATSTAMHGHFLTTSMQMLAYQSGAAVMDIYTPCGTENGIAEDLSNSRSQLAVESRMSPLFVHDPRKGTTLRERFSLDGNPDVGKTWTTSTLEYIGDNGELQLMDTPLTPAEFALGEVRFKKQFKKLSADDEAAALPIAEYVELSLAEREGHVPFVYATDADKRLIKVACSHAIVGLVEDRKRFWQTLQYLAGQHEDQLTGDHRTEVEALKKQYEELLELRESSLDDIASAMSALAASSKAPARGRASIPLTVTGGSSSAVATAPAPAASCAEVAEGSAGPVYLDPADEPKCNDCGTCYQELPQFFEKKTAIIDGESRTIATMVPGAIDSVQITPEIQKRIDRVKSACDAEIIK